MKSHPRFHLLNLPCALARRALAPASSIGRLAPHGTISDHCHTTDTQKPQIGHMDFDAEHAIRMT
jgi:hypothetical protein